MTNIAQLLSNCPENLSGPIGAAFLMLLNAIVIEKCKISTSDVYPDDYGPKLLEGDAKERFDIIIVGGGAAGCVLANRLSEVDDWNILLLEAGKNPSITSDIPGFYANIQGTEEDWHFITEKEDNICQGLKKKKCTISRGKVLGGTSSINNLHYTRAFPHDFSSWPGLKWKPEDIMKHYNKIEQCKGPNCIKHCKYNTDGVLLLDELNETNEIRQLIYDGARIMGYEKLITNSHLGYTEMLGTVYKGARQNFAKAFLRPVKKRKNLFVAKNAYVTKILTQLPRDNKIQGVTVQIGDQEVTVKCKKEIVLAAGAIKTAHLLMLSGFGPKNVLEGVKIKPIVELNVGKNLQDQVSVLIFVGIDRDRPETNWECKMVDSTYTYLLHRQGSLAQTNINDLVGFVNTNGTSEGHPDVLIYHYHFQRDDPGLAKYLENVGFTEKIVKSILTYNKNESLILFKPTLIKPKSRGEMTLKSKNPFDQPTIKGNYLSDNEDFQTLLSGVKYILNMINTRPFKEHGAHFLDVDMPNCRNMKYPNEPYIKCVVKNMAIPRSQVIGTAVSGESSSVTNDEFLVDGIRHLRVVDGSVFPNHITGNLEGTVGMIASKISEDIKTFWLKNET